MYEYFDLEKSCGQIAIAIEESGLHPTLIAGAMGLSYTAVMSWIKGIKFPTIDNLVLLAQIVNKDVAYFIKTNRS